MEKTISESRESYAWQLAAGTCSASLKSTAEEQVNRYTEAQIANQALLMQAKQVLTQRGIPAGEYLAYYAFAERLARLCRTYSARVLEQGALNLIDRWEFRGLDPETLLAVRDKVFGFEGRTDSTQRHQELSGSELSGTGVLPQRHKDHQGSELRATADARRRIDTGLWTLDLGLRSPWSMVHGLWSVLICVYLWLNLRR